MKRVRELRTALAGAIVVVFPSAVASAQSTDAPTRGWAMVSECASDHSVRSAGSASFSIVDGEVIDSSIDCSSGSMHGRARWKGVIRIATPGRYTFICEVHGGRVAIDPSFSDGTGTWHSIIDGVSATEARTELGALDLPRGELSIGLSFRPKTVGAAADCRLLWQREGDEVAPGFGPEPIQSRFVHV